MVRQDPGNQALIDQHGGIADAVTEIATGITTGMYNALFGTKDTQPFAEPYITSFCTAATERIGQHGLLSQWRGYGQEGGYAIVFDTSHLELLLKEERQNWNYSLFFGGDVIYSSDKDEKIHDELGNDIGDIKTNVTQWLMNKGAPEHLEKIHDALIQCACRYKHWGFNEEKEVRVIAIPPNIEVLKDMKARGLFVADKPRRHFARAGTPVPCIHLFEGITELPEKPLPITRIIIGPHREKDKRQRAVEILLTQYGLDIPVSVSEIPYVGHP